MILACELNKANTVLKSSIKLPLSNEPPPSDKSPLFWGRKLIRPPSL